MFSWERPRGGRRKTYEMSIRTGSNLIVHIFLLRLFCAVRRRSGPWHLLPDLWPVPRNHAKYTQEILRNLLQYALHLQESGIFSRLMVVIPRFLRYRQVIETLPFRRPPYPYMRVPHHGASFSSQIIQYGSRRRDVTVSTMLFSKLEQRLPLWIYSSTTLFATFYEERVKRLL